MRACIIVAAVIALSQPAVAATSHKKNSHRSGVSHLSHHSATHRATWHRRAYVRLRRIPIEPGYAMPQAFASANATGRHAFGDPSFQNQPWRQSWAATAPQGAFSGESVPRRRNALVHDGTLDAMIARHAAENGLPAELVHRVVMRESGYNPHARNGGNLGLMQIKHATARGVGYAGPPSGLMDPETNLTYAVRYLAGAYRAAGGNARRAVALYASGYHRRGVPDTTPAVAAPWWLAQTTPGQW